MLTVKKYEVDDLESVVAFIRKVQKNAKPCEKILSRSVLIKDDAHIVGMVAYESHDYMGVIRYFLYDANIKRVDIIIDLFCALYKNASEDKIKQLIAKAPTMEVSKLFEILGFNMVQNEKNEIIMKINL